MTALCDAKCRLRRRATVGASVGEEAPPIRRPVAPTVEGAGSRWRRRFWQRPLPGIGEEGCSFSLHLLAPADFFFRVGVLLGRLLRRDCLEGRHEQPVEVRRGLFAALLPELSAVSSMETSASLSVSFLTSSLEPLLVAIRAALIARSPTAASCARFHSCHAGLTIPFQGELTRFFLSSSVSALAYASAASFAALREVSSSNGLAAHPAAG